jgi:DNA-binding NarL/FixJ family response regulator
MQAVETRCAMTDRGPDGSADELQVETIPRPRASVLLVYVQYARPIGVREVVREDPEFRLVGHVPYDDTAVEAAKRHRADIIVVAVDGTGSEVDVKLVSDLQSASPESSLVVCAIHFDPTVSAALEQLQVDGILAWKDVTIDNLHDTLVAVSQGVQVTSPSVNPL